MQIGNHKELLLLGSGELLKRLSLWAIDNGLSVKVLTSPRQADEGDLRKFCQKNNIRYLVSESITSPEVKSFVDDITHTFCLSIGAAWIFKADTLTNLFNNRLFNMHGTRLPQNRGGGGFSWQILTGNRFGFSVLHLVDTGVDTGDIIAFDEFLYPPKCRTPKDFDQIFVDQDFFFITNFLSETKNIVREFTPIKQPEYLASYWPRLHTLTNGWINWNLDASSIERFICAFDDPYAGAQTLWNDRKVHLKGVSLNLQDATFHPYQSGIVYRKGKNWLCVCVPGASLIVEKVTDENGKDIFDLIQNGDRFFTPYEELENTRNRIVFDPNGLKKTSAI